MDESSLFSLLQDSRPLQDVEVPGRRRDPHMQPVRHVSDRLRAVAQSIDNPEADRLAQRPEQAGTLVGFPVT
jgi:hypothetical protein